MPINPDDLTNALKILSAGTANKPQVSGGNSNAPLNKYVLSPLGKVLNVLDTDLNLVTQGMRPLVTSMNPSLEEVYRKKGFDTVPSDLIDATIPGKNPLKGVLGFAADVGLSPTTYLAGIGGFTEMGKVAKAAAAAKESGLSIQTGSKLALDIEKHFGPGIKGIARAQKGLAPTLAEQAERGQRALIHLGIPFTGIDKPVMRGQAILARAGEAASAIKKSQMGEAFTKIFSTTSGNPELDKLRQQFTNLGKLYEAEALGKATDYAKQVKIMAKKLNTSYEELHQVVYNMVENPMYGALTADILRASNLNKITDWKLYANGTIDKTINKMMGFNSLSTYEKGKAYRQITRELLVQQGGINVYTPGTRILAPEYIDEFSNIFTKQADMNLIKDLKMHGGKYNMVSMSELMRNYLNGVKTEFGHLKGDDALVYSLGGKSEYARVKNIQNNLDKLHDTPAFALLPKAIQLGTGTEYKQMATVGRELLGHIETQFALNHALYRTNPEYLKKMNPVVHEIFTRLYKESSWKIDELINTYKVTKNLANKYPGLFETALNMRRLVQTQYTREFLSGVPSKEMIADINHLEHIPTKENRKFLESRKGFSGASRQWTPEHANKLQKEFRRLNDVGLNEAYNSNLLTKKQYMSIRTNGLEAVDRLVKSKKITGETSARFVHTLTADEVNKLAAEGKLKILGGKKVNKFFDTNPSNVFRIRSMRGEKARTAAEFFQAVREKKMGIPVPPSGFIPAGMKTVTAPGLEGLMFENDIADHISKFGKAASFSTQDHPFIQLGDRIQDIWKAWTLAIWPAYHTRNVIGNLWNNFLAGMDNPGKHLRYYQDALDLQHSAGEVLFKGMKTLDQIENDPKVLAKLGAYKLTLPSGQIIDGKEIIAQAKANGILNIGQFWGDVSHYFEEEASIMSKFTHNPAITGGLRVGNYFQNNANLAHYIWRLKEGDGFVESARSVKKYQFDYADLSDTERDLFRRIFPFYSWTRKNVPLQLEALMTHPSKPMGVLKLKNAIESDADGVPDERLLPDWMVRSFPIRAHFNKDTKNYEYFLLGGWLPLNDIDRLFDPAAMATNMLSPIIKEPFQQLANRDFFFGKEIDSGGEYERIAGINMPARVAHVLKNVRAINEVKKFSDEDTNLQTKILQFATGKVYPLVEEKERIGKEIRYSKRESNLNRLLRRAEAKGDSQEINRLVNELQNLAVQRSELQ